MFLRLLMSAVLITGVAACSTTDEDMVADENITISERQDISQGQTGEGYDPVGSESLYGDQDSSGMTGGSTQQDLVVNVGDRVFFSTDSYSLTSEARVTLENQAKWLQQRPNINITIEGHADERGTREYNLALGERRANAAQNYLVALGVPTNRINVVSYGKERPAVPGSNASAWSQNRRSVTQVN